MRDLIPVLLMGCAATFINSFLDHMQACIQQSALTLEGNECMYDSRYFCFDDKWIGRCSCAIVQEVVVEIIVQHHPDFMEGEGWKKAFINCPDENRVIKGYLAEGIIFSHIRTHGLKFVNDDLEAMPQSPFFDVPNWSELRLDGRTYRRLFVPTRFNYEAIDAVIALMEKKRGKKPAPRRIISKEKGKQKKGKKNAKEGEKKTTKGKGKLKKKEDEGGEKDGRDEGEESDVGEGIGEGKVDGGEGGGEGDGREGGEEDKSENTDQLKGHISFKIFLIQITIADNHSNSENLFFENLWKKYHDSILKYLDLISDAKGDGEKSDVDIIVTFVWFHGKKATTIDKLLPIPPKHCCGDITTYSLHKLPIERIIPPDFSR